MDRKEFNEMIHYCFINSKKRKKFQRVFKGWTKKEKNSFLNNVGIDTYTDIEENKLKVYLDSNYNILYFCILYNNNIIAKYIVRSAYADAVPSEVPLI